LQRLHILRQYNRDGYVVLPMIQRQVMHLEEVGSRAGSAMSATA
jgi:hypothetical protein